MVDLVLLDLSHGMDRDGCIVSQYHDIDTTITVPGMSPDPTTIIVVPKVDKIVVNCVIGEAAQNIKGLDAVIRDNLTLGIAVTLRGNKFTIWWIWYYWICPMAWTVTDALFHSITVPGMSPDPTTIIVVVFVGWNMPSLYCLKENHNLHDETEI
ncbi:Ribosomal protein L5 [Artemisia annua]|uniref:Ribosomal protein L5 n=1 Tax=Artemisia annua TaxID=35608 RepID=A0A2U1PCZ8_ARTAN|nr:Ribosomal protein L5 [Artemisia annua]